MEKNKISSKILMKFIFNQMKKLDENKITVEQGSGRNQILLNRQIIYLNMNWIKQRY